MIPIILDHTRPQVTVVHVLKKLFLIHHFLGMKRLRPFAGASEGQAGLRWRNQQTNAIDFSTEGWHTMGFSDLYECQKLWLQLDCLEMFQAETKKRSRLGTIDCISCLLPENLTNFEANQAGKASQQCRINVCDVPFLPLSCEHGMGLSECCNGTNYRLQLSW